MPAALAALSIMLRAKKQLYAVRTGGFKVGNIISAPRAIPIRRSLAFAIDAAFSTPFADSIAAIMPVVPTGMPASFFNALNLAFTVDNILCAVRLRQANDLHAGADNGLKVRNSEST